MRVDELVIVEEKINRRKNRTSKLNVTNATEDEEREDKLEEEKPKSKIVKRPNVFPISKITKEFYGQPTLTKEQMQKIKERIRSYEKRDEDKIKTDKAKNDFESVIYALRDWLGDESNQPFVKADDNDSLMNKLREEEDWLLEGEGDNANVTEYIKRFADLNSRFN